MQYNTYFHMMAMMDTMADMPKGSDMYKEGGLKCKSISNMERMLDQEAKTNFKEKSNDANQKS